MKSPHCESRSDRKHGRYRGVQRYVCKSGWRSFTSRGERCSRQLKAQALERYLNQVGVRKMARFVKASPAGVLKWIRAAHARLSQPLTQAKPSLTQPVPDLIERDEIYTLVQKNSSGPSYGLLIVGDRVA